MLEPYTRRMTSSRAHPPQRILLTEMLTTELVASGRSWTGPPTGCEAASLSRR
jgi:hypothetical protein